MKKLFSFSIVSIIFCIINFSCSVENRKASVYQYSISLPIALNPNGSVSAMIDTTTIYTYGKDLMYKVPYQFNSPKNNGLITQYSYFLVRKGRKYGYEYKEIQSNIESGIKVLLDSSILTRLTRIRPLVIDNKEVFAKNSTTSKSDTCKEYLVKSPDGVKLDTVYCYYTKSLRKAPFSLYYTSYQDKRRRKLYKLRKVSHSYFDEKLHMLLPQMELLLELRKIDFSVQEEASVKGFMKNFDEALKKHLISQRVL